MITNMDNTDNFEYKMKIVINILFSVLVILKLINICKKNVYLFIF